MTGEEFTDRLDAQAKKRREMEEKMRMDSMRSDYYKAEKLKNAKNNGFFKCKKCGSRKTTFYQQ